MEERYHATTQNRFYPDVSNVNKNITVEEKLISPPSTFPSQYERPSFTPIHKSGKNCGAVYLNL